MKRILSVLLIVSMVFSMMSSITIVSAETDSSFSDVLGTNAAWANEYIEKMVTQNILAGVGDGKFEPSNPLTREQFAKLLVLAVPKEDKGIKIEFTDVVKGQWYEEYVKKAVATGVIKGKDDGKFGVSENIKRCDMALGMARLDKTDEELKAYEEKIPATVEDKEDIPDYAKGAMGYCYENKIICGNDEGKFNPQGKTTRAEMAKVICVYVENQKSDVTDETSKEETTTEPPVTDEDIRKRDPDATNLIFNNRHFDVSDADGPAYVIYSNKGYNKASIDIKLSKLEINNIRKSDGKFLNAYLFLGMNIYDSEGNWVNCFDSGIGWTGKKGGWHLFYYLYSTESEDTYRWYESNVILDSTHDYRIILDSSQKNGKSTLYALDLNTNEIVDSVEFESQYSIKTGSNTSYIQDYAFDYPEEVKFDTSGRYSEDDFEEITLYNTDENIYMKNIIVENAKIYKRGEEYDWTMEHTKYRTLWPSKTNTKIDYPVVKIWIKKQDNSFVIDIDMNRKK